MILAVAAGAVALYVYDYQGPLETISGEVGSTRTYPHQTATEPLHTHTEAMIEFEGRSHTVSQADGVKRGQKVVVVVKRGRLSGRPRFVDFRPVRGGSP